MKIIFWYKKYSLDKRYYNEKQKNAKKYPIGLVFEIQLGCHTVCAEYIYSPKFLVN
jgi:hypothetical protein